MTGAGAASLPGPGAGVDADAGFEDGDDLPTGDVSAVDPAPHEFGGNLIFTAHGLSPFFGLIKAAKETAVYEEGSGAVERSCRALGQRWEVEFFPKASGLAPREDDALESVKEFVLSVRAEASEGSDVRERKATFNVSPRWPEMESVGDAPDPSTPDIEGVNVRVNGSNIRAENYPVLLREAMEAVNVRRRYFSTLDPMSNVYTYERYARVDRRKSGALIGMGGPMHRLLMHVADGAGVAEMKVDNRKIEGYYHTVSFDDSAADRVLPGHRFAKHIKHYHPKHPRADAGSDDPLAHPKVGVSFKKTMQSDGAVPWGEVATLEDELDGLLLNLLAWSGIPVRSGASTFVGDAYFRPDGSRRVTIHENPLPAIKAADDRALTESLTLTGERTGSDVETVKLLADGGTVGVEEAAAETGYSSRTIYRVADRLSDVLEVVDGLLRFRSEYLARGARSALESAIGKVEAGARAARDSSSAFQAWADRYGVEVDRAGSVPLLLRFGEVPADESVPTMLKRGLLAWERSGNPRHKWRGRAEWRADGRRCIRVLSPDG